MDFSIGQLECPHNAAAGFCQSKRSQRTENCLELCQIILVVILGEGCNVFYDLASEVTFHHVHNALLITQVSPWWEGCECQGQSHCMATLEADCYISHKIKGHFNGISWEFPSMSLNTNPKSWLWHLKRADCTCWQKSQRNEQGLERGRKIHWGQCRKGLDLPIRKKKELDWNT